MTEPRTVWSKNANPLVPSRFRSLYTVLLPLIDFGVVIFGLVSLLLGSQIVGDFTIPIFLPLWALMITLGATASLMGLIFFRPKLELTGLTAAMLGLIVYAGLSMLYIMHGSVTAALLLILVIIRIIFYLWRFFDLLGQTQRKEAAKAVSTGEISTRGKHHE